MEVNSIPEADHAASPKVVGQGAPSSKPLPSHRRVLLASFIGTGVEFYDFYIYATAASLVFGQLFFPTASPFAQQMFAFSTLAVAFIARPLGSIAFGHFGDRVGRKSTLVVSLLTMGLSTVLVAVLPTYAQAGWIAPFALCVLRFGQGFGLGGEWGGAALLAVENAPPGWRARYGAAPQMGAPAGFLAANGLFLLLGYLLTPDQFKDWGWRIPFALSVVMVGLGLWVRLRISETPAFSKMLAEGHPPAVPLGEMLRNHLGVFVTGTLGAVTCFALYYIATAFLLGYGTKTLGYPMQSFLGVQLGAICFLGIGIMLSAWLADHSSERTVLAWGCALTIPASLLIAPMVESGSLFLVFGYLALILMAMGFVYGPLGGWLPQLFPARVRYTGASMSFNTAGVIGGGLTPLFAQKLANDAGSLQPVGFYTASAAALSLAALVLLAGRRRNSQ